MKYLVIWRSNQWRNNGVSSMKISVAHGINNRKQRRHQAMAAAAWRRKAGVAAAQRISSAGVWRTSRRA
jgi:hypothetical protein